MYELKLKPFHHVLSWYSCTRSLLIESEHTNRVLNAHADSKQINFLLFAQDLSEARLWIYW